MTVPFREGTHAILIGDDLLQQLVEQANPDKRVTIHWGEPDEDGIYEPVVRTFDLLTPTEHQVLALLADGEGQASVAGRMGVSHQTVKNHLQHVYDRLGTGGAIGTFRKLGWLRPR